MDRRTLGFLFSEKEAVGSRSQDSVLKVPRVGATPSQLEEITYCPASQSWVSPMEAEEGGRRTPLQPPLQALRTWEGRAGPSGGWWKTSSGHGRVCRVLQAIG